MNGTIAAICTPMGSGAIGVVRLSGENALSIVDKFFKPYKLNSLLQAQPNMMYLGVYRSENLCDRCLCVYFKAPHSYTGEDVVELQVHGGARLVSQIFVDLTNNGAIPAERGEFTKRAFYNGKMSLTEAEGIAEMINADSLSAIRAAYRKQSGALDKGIDEVKNAVVEAIAYAESGLDNPDEMEADAIYGAFGAIGRSVEKVEELLKRGEQSTFVRDGIKVGIVGKTNRGKSSILNALCEKDRAIVTEIAGTTRDTLEESVEYKGVKLIFVDTAGIRESDDVVERIGVERSKAVANSADALIFVIEEGKSMDDEEAEFLKLHSDKPVIICKNKSDLFGKSGKDVAGYKCVSTSAQNGEGIAELLEAVYSSIVNKADGGAEIVLNQRQTASLKEAERILASAYKNVKDVTLDCTLVELYDALKVLTALDGSDVVGMVVDKVFEKFCVGK